MIGFKTDNDVPEPEKLPNEEVLAQLFESIMNPPEWQVAYEQTLFWALIFNTHDKVHKC
jgi:hypothetical protein